MLLYRVLDPETGRPAHAVERDGRFFRILTPFEDWLELIGQGRELDYGAPLGDKLGTGLGADERLDVLAPVSPSKVVCVGLNYRQHAEEMDKTIPEVPLLFMKPPTAIIGPGESIELPEQSREVHHEGELAVVIGAQAKGLDPKESSSVVLGYMCANDVTARDIQRREKRYTRGKGFDTFCPLGPAIATADAFHPAEHRLECRVDGELRQSSTLDDFIFSIPEVISSISHVMTLCAGDVILTGTPAGVGPLKSGQTVSVEIDGIGRLENPVISL